jgi:hypothetical protein
MLDNMARVAKMLGSSGVTLQNVRDTLYAEGMSDYDIFLTCKGAALLYPHVAQVVQEESIPPTERA